MNALLNHDLEEVGEMTEETKQRFQITDLASLTWGLRKLAALEEKKNEISAVIDTEIERLEEYRKRELQGLQENGDFFRALISEYAIKQRDADPKFKSEKTPYGSIGFRKQQPKWTYDDEVLIEFLEINELAELIRIKKEPVKTEIKKLFKLYEGQVFDTNGQAVEGITVEVLPDAFDIKVGG